MNNGGALEMEHSAVQPCQKNGDNLKWVAN